MVSFTAGFLVDQIVTHRQGQLSCMLSSRRVHRVDQKVVLKERIVTITTCYN
jgi:hypothetical protein